MKILDRIDEYFSQKAQKDMIMIYVMVAMIVGFIVLYFLWPQAQEYRNREIKLFRKTQSQLNQLRIQKNILSSRIVLLKKRIKNLTLEKNGLKKQKDFYDELANLLDFVEFNQYKWGNFVKNLVFNAKKEGLRVLGFKNVLFNEKKGLINKKMEITLTVEGGYKNLLYLIYHYENIRDLLRVEEMKINNNEIYKVKFTLYGYEK